MTNVLIVEDESTIRDMLQFILTPAGFDIWEAWDVREAEKQLMLRHPDLILLDWMLPDQSGIQFTKKLKRDVATQNIPIIMLTAKAEEENKIKGLEMGADDYVTKPFSPRELIARIKTVLRRGPLISLDGMIKVDNICLNVNNRQLKINHDRVSLSPIEYKLLHFFMTHPNRIYNRDQLLDWVWGKEHYVNERTVDVQIRRLRRRLQRYQCDRYIQTIRGTGYQFSVNP